MSLVTEDEVRNFFTPSLTIAEISSAELTAKISAVDDFILAVYGFTNTDSTNAHYPALLLVASKIVQSNPSLASSHGTVKSEKMGDVTFTYGTTDASSISDLYTKAASWETMAIQMLEARNYLNRWRFEKVND